MGTKNEAKKGSAKEAKKERKDSPRGPENMRKIWKTPCGTCFPHTHTPSKKTKPYLILTSIHVLTWRWRRSGLGRRGSGSGGSGGGGSKVVLMRLETTTKIEV